MNFLAYRGADRRPLIRELLLVCVLTPFVWSCAKNGATVAAADSQGRLQGNGFRITLPQGEGWILKEEKGNSIVFEKNTKPREEDREKGPKFVHARLGVESLPAGDAQSVDNAGFPDAAKAILAKRYDVLSDDFEDIERSSLVELTVQPYSKNGALCVNFKAKQIEPAPTRQSVEQMVYEYVNHGFLCRHPQDNSIVLHGYINETNYRNNPRSLDPETEKEAEKFFEDISFTPVR